MSGFGIGTINATIDESTLATSANQVTSIGDITKGVYIFGAQLAMANHPGIYTPTTTTAVTTGIRSQCGNTSQNLIAKSSDMATAGPWAAGGGCSVSAVGDGSFRVQLSNGVYSYLQTTPTMASCGTYTVALDVKSNTGSAQTFRMRVPDQVGVSNQHTASLTATSDWQRFAFTFAVRGNGAVALLLPESDASNSAADLLVRRPQLNFASFAAAYQETTGTAITTPIRSLAD